MTELAANARPGGCPSDVLPVPGPGCGCRSGGRQRLGKRLNGSVQQPPTLTLGRHELLASRGRCELCCWRRRRPCIALPLRCGSSGWPTDAHRECFAFAVM